jgi:hypothetical protein
MTPKGEHLFPESNKARRGEAASIVLCYVSALSAAVKVCYLTSNRHLSTLANGLPCAAGSIDIAVP